ncbi:MAG: hypothetical protein R2856_34025 [Caldilineaceae bacterium]
MPDNVTVHRDVAYVRDDNARSSISSSPMPTASAAAADLGPRRRFAWAANKTVSLSYLTTARRGRFNYRLSQHATLPRPDRGRESRRALAARPRRRLQPRSQPLWRFAAASGGDVGRDGSCDRVRVGEHLDVSSRVQAVADHFGPTDFLQMDAHRLPDGMVHDVADSPESELVGGPIQSIPSAWPRPTPSPTCAPTPRPSSSSTATRIHLSPLPERAAQRGAANGRRAGHILHGEGGAWEFRDPQVKVLTRGILEQASARGKT